MKTKVKGKTIGIVLASVVLLAFVLGGPWMASANLNSNEGDDDKSGNQAPWRRFFKPLLRRYLRYEVADDLELKAELEALREEVIAMRESGATPADIREYVAEKFEELGIELPCPRLTEEQWEILQDLLEEAKELRESGATPQEIREHLKEKAEEHGFQLPLRGLRRRLAFRRRFIRHLLWRRFMKGTEPSQDN